MPLLIDSDFPGGNIVVESIDGDEVRVHQDLRDTSHDWFYWCFRVRGGQGRRVRFLFTRSLAIGVRGPAVSLDQGWSWRWLGREAVGGNVFCYTFGADGEDVRFSFAMPYQQMQWRRFADRLGESSAFSRHALCRTAKDREVEFALAGCNDREPLHRVAITCRHHCCEMMAGYALEGLIEWIVIDPSTEALWLRQNVQFFIVPMVDVDGVEDGDQGKDRQPRDHGRDYADDSIYASTGAIRRRLPAWGEGRLRVGLDLHCPWIRG